MNTRTTTLLVLVLIALATLTGLALWDRLPDPMASHWNTYDQVDGYMSKFWGVFLMPLISSMRSRCPRTGRVRRWSLRTGGT